MTTTTSTLPDLDDEMTTYPPTGRIEARAHHGVRVWVVRVRAPAECDGPMYFDRASAVAYVTAWTPERASEGK